MADNIMVFLPHNRINIINPLRPERILLHVTLIPRYPEHKVLRIREVVFRPGGDTGDYVTIVSITYKEKERERGEEEIHTTMSIRIQIRHKSRPHPRGQITQF